MRPAARVASVNVGQPRPPLHLRVLAEGAVRAGDTVHRVRRPHPDWSLSRLHRLVHSPAAPEERAAAAALSELSAELRRRFAGGR